MLKIEKNKTKQNTTKQKINWKRNQSIFKKQTFPKK